MTKCVVNSIIIILLLFLNQELFGNKMDDSLVATINLPGKIIKDWKELEISLLIHSNYKKTITVPHNPIWGYIQDSTGYVLLQMQKKSGHSYVNIEPAGRINYPVPGNNTPVIDTLSSGAVKTIKFSLGLSFNFNQGYYRVRVLCLASLLDSTVKDVYSNWFYFYSTNKLLPHQ